jgi:hypothetical protein
MLYRRWGFRFGSGAAVPALSADRFPGALVAEGMTAVGR